MPYGKKIKLTTQGVSWKVLADLLVSVAAFAVTNGLIEIDPVTAGLISKALGSVAGVLAPANDVEPANG